MAWCFSTRASVATVLTTHPCVSWCLSNVKGLAKQADDAMEFSPMLIAVCICHLCHNVYMMTSSNGNIPRYWPFVRGIHRSPVNSPNKGQWRGALVFSFICALNRRLSKHCNDLKRLYDAVSFVYITFITGRCHHSSVDADVAEALSTLCV